MRGGWSGEGVGLCEVNAKARGRWIGMVAKGSALRAEAGCDLARTSCIWTICPHMVFVDMHAMGIKLCYFVPCEARCWSPRKRAVTGTASNTHSASSITRQWIWSGRNDVSSSPFNK